MNASATDEYDIPRLTPAVQWIIAINVAVFFLQLTVVRPADMVAALAFKSPGDLTQRPWTIATYMFVHAGFLHLAFNMWTLWLFGPRLEQARHLSDLTSLILKLGGQPRARRDLRGPLWETWTALSASFGDQAALRALMHAEQSAARSYAQAIDAEVPPAAAPLVLSGLGEHRRRLAWFRPRVHLRAQANKRAIR